MIRVLRLHHTENQHVRKKVNLTKTQVDVSLTMYSDLHLPVAVMPVGYHNIHNHIHPSLYNYPRNILASDLSLFVRPKEFHKAVPISVSIFL